MPCLSEMEWPDTGGEQISVPRDLEEGERSGSKSVYGSDLCCKFYRKEAAMSPSPAESSSIGMNSDDEGEEEGENEVQGPLRGGLKASMDSLEEALPMRRGISPKSFASLADASSYQSMKSIVKPETAYSRRRRNLLVHARKTTTTGPPKPPTSSKPMVAEYPRNPPPLDPHLAEAPWPWRLPWPTPTPPSTKLPALVSLMITQQG